MSLSCPKSTVPSQEAEGKCKVLARLIIQYRINKPIGYNHTDDVSQKRRRIGAPLESSLSKACNEATLDIDLAEILIFVRLGGFGAGHGTAPKIDS